MGEIVNLRRETKRRARMAAAEVAQENRVRHGRTATRKAAEAKAEADRQSALDGHRLAPTGEEPDPAS